MRKVRINASLAKPAAFFFSNLSPVCKELVSIVKIGYQTITDYGIKLSGRYNFKISIYSLIGLKITSMDFLKSTQVFHVTECLTISNEAMT